MAAEWIYCHDPMSKHYELPPPDEVVMVLLRGFDSGGYVGLVLPAMRRIDPYESDRFIWIAMSGSPRSLHPFAWLKVPDVKGEEIFIKIAEHGRQGV